MAFLFIFENMLHSLLVLAQYNYLYNRKLITLLVFLGGNRKAWDNPDE
jgi:hypothetical protein